MARIVKVFFWRCWLVWARRNYCQSRRCWGGSEKNVGGKSQVRESAEDNTASCWKKVITIIRRILVVSDLKTTTSRHNLSAERLVPSSRQNQARSSVPRFIASIILNWLKVISAHQSSPTHVIRPLICVGPFDTPTYETLRLFQVYIFKSWKIIFISRSSIKIVVVFARRRCLYTWHL